MTGSRRAARIGHASISLPSGSGLVVIVPCPPLSSVRCGFSRAAAALISTRRVTLGTTRSPPHPREISGAARESRSLPCPALARGTYLYLVSRGLTAARGCVWQSCLHVLFRLLVDSPVRLRCVLSQVLGAISSPLTWSLGFAPSSSPVTLLVILLGILALPSGFCYRTRPPLALAYILPASCPLRGLRFTGGYSSGGTARTLFQTHPCSPSPFSWQFGAPIHC